MMLIQMTHATKNGCKALPCHIARVQYGDAFILWLFILLKCVCVCVNSFWFEWYVLLPAYYFFRLLHGTLGNILFIYICWSIDFFELIANNKQQSCPTRHIIFIFDLVCCGGFYSCNLTKGMNENWTCWMSWSEYGTCLCPRCKQISCFVKLDFFLFVSSVCTRWHWF